MNLPSLNKILWHMPSKIYKSPEYSRHPTSPFFTPFPNTIPFRIGFRRIPTIFFANMQDIFLSRELTPQPQFLRAVSLPQPQFLPASCFRNPTPLTQFPLVIVSPALLPPSLSHL